MFKWFRRQDPPQDDDSKSSTPRSVPARKERPASRSPKPPQPLSDALPEVVGEGNTQADWSMW